MNQMMLQAAIVVWLVVASVGAGIMFIVVRAAVLSALRAHAREQTAHRTST
jgi:hypothetical protein